MSDEEREKVLAKVRRFLSDDAPIDWQRLKTELPSQREWVEANEGIDGEPSVKWLENMRKHDTGVTASRPTESSL